MVVSDGIFVKFRLKEAELDPLLNYSTSEIRERLVEKYRISDYAMMVRNTIHEITKIVSTSLFIHIQKNLLTLFEVCSIFSTFCR
jgi:hypothetical protein